MIARLKPMPLAFWRASSGREPVREWLQAMEKPDRSAVGLDLRAIQFGWPIGMPLVRKLTEAIWEARSSLPSRREARLLFTANKEQIIVLHGFIKKTQKTPRGEIELALKRLREMVW